MSTPNKNSNRNSSVQVAKINKWQAIIVAAITATVSISVALITTQFKLEDKVNSNQVDQTVQKKVTAEAIRLTNKDLDSISQRLRDKYIDEITEKMTNQGKDEQINKSPIGSIISSVVPYEQFMRLNKFNLNNTISKNIWAPCDGRNVSGSDYSHFNSNVPDLRGVFLRGLNQLYQNNKGAGNIKLDQLDINNTRSAGSFQAESTKLPNSGFKISYEGEHTHKYQIKFIGGEEGEIAWEKNKAKRKTEERTTKPSNKHNHSVTGGDKETRPKNVAVYYYIKINESQY